MGAEPLDVALAEVCRTRTLPIQRSTDVTFVSDTAEDVAVEWIDFPLAGSARTLATRRFRLVKGVPSPIEVARSDKRFLRFSRPGVSPVTVSALDMPTVKASRLPAPVPGGEWFARMVPAAIVAERYRLLGPWGGELAPSPRQLVSRQGLPPGLYQVVPVYRGGPSGAPIQARIADGQSTMAWLPAEAVGAVAAGIESRLCGEVVGFGVDRTQGVRSAGIRGQQVASVVDLPGHECFPVVAGLVPGTYSVRFSSARGLIGAQTVAVTAQHTATAYVGANGASVTGQITLNDEPFAGVTVTFNGGGDSGGRPTEAETDGDGRYALSVPEAGTYRMTLRSGRTPLTGPLKSVGLKAGENVVDWSISGGTIVVRLPNWDRDTLTLVTVSLRGSAGPGPANLRTTWPIERGDDYPVRVRGVPFARYSVRAEQPGGRVSRNVEVAVSRERPTVTVDLDLVENRSVLIVRDDAGKAVQGARVQAIGRVTEQAPGVFSMAGVTPSTPATVSAPGYVPVCRMVNADGEEVVALARGRAVRVAFSRPLASMSAAPPGLVAGHAGSACPVRLSAFDLQFVKNSGPAGDAVTEVLVRNFPVEDSLTFFWGTDPTPQPITVGGDGVVRVTIPPQKR